MVFNSFAERSIESLLNAVLLRAVRPDSMMRQAVVREQADELAGDESTSIVAADRWLRDRFAIAVRPQCFNRPLGGRADRVAIHAGEQFPVDQVTRILIDEVTR